MSTCLSRPAALRILASVAAILLVLLGAFGLARADTLSGRVYAPDARAGSVLFTWELERDLTTGHWRSSYRTLEGVLAAENEVLWDGDVFRSYRYTRPAIGEVVERGAAKRRAAVSTGREGSGP
jgi:hypothetical protein